MTSIPETIAAWQMLQPQTRHRETGEIIPGRLELVQLPVPALAQGEVLVEIAGCGVCEADLCCFYDGVATAAPPPLALGYEIAGTVVAGEPSWLGREVLLAAIGPCGHCPSCRTGRGDLCRAPMIAGAAAGVYGGFASHVPVAASSLCTITDRRTIPLEHMAAIADTVATAFEAVRRAALEAGDNVVVIGAGGIGPFIVQIAKVFGAATVMVVDSVAARLQRTLRCGADLVIGTAATPAETAAEVGHLQAAAGRRAAGWKIFEASGTEAGRETALALVGKGGRLVQVAAGSAVAEDARSRPHASEAEIIAVRRCPPGDYPRVVELVTEGKIVLAPFIQTRPMSWIKEVFAAARMTPPDRHTILTADDIGLEVSPEPKSCR